MEGGIAVRRRRQGRRVYGRRLRRNARASPAMRRAGRSRCTHARGRPAISPARPWRSAISPTTPRRRASPPRRAPHGVPVNVIDKPKFCDFAFGAIVNRSPLVIGISTDGAAPVFGQAIRAKLEAMLPQGFSGWADAARRWRDARQDFRPVVRSAPPLLAIVHRARDPRSRAGAGRRRLRSVAGAKRAIRRRPRKPARSPWSAPARAIRNCSRCARCARCNPPT